MILSFKVFPFCLHPHCHRLLHSFIQSLHWLHKHTAVNRSAVLPVLSESSSFLMMGCIKSYTTLLIGAELG